MSQCLSALTPRDLPQSHPPPGPARLEDRPMTCVNNRVDAGHQGRASQRERHRANAAAPPAEWRPGAPSSMHPWCLSSLSLCAKLRVLHWLGTRRLRRTAARCAMDHRRHPTCRRRRCEPRAIPRVCGKGERVGPRSNGLLSCGPTRGGLGRIELRLSFHSSSPATTLQPP